MPPTGTGPSFTRKTFVFSVLLVVAVGTLPVVLDISCTCIVIPEVVVLQTIKPRTTVAATEPPASYIVLTPVTPAFVTVLNVFGINHPNAIANAVTSSDVAPVAVVKIAFVFIFTTPAEALDIVVSEA